MPRCGGSSIRRSIVSGAASPVRAFCGHASRWSVSRSACWRSRAWLRMVRGGAGRHPRQSAGRWSRWRGRPPHGAHRFRRYLDIVCDFIVYAGVAFGFALARPEKRRTGRLF